MRSAKRIIPLILAITLIFSFTLFPSAATGKAVYVITRMNGIDYATEEGDSDTAIVCKVSYDKNGLISKYSLKDAEGLYALKGRFSYSKGSKLSSRKTNAYLLGENYGTLTGKYKVNGKGLVTAIYNYDEKGKTDSILKFSYDKKGNCTKTREYNAKGKLKETRKYKYLKNGDKKSRRIYNAKGKLKSYDEVNYENNKTRISTYNAKGKLIQTTEETLKNGRVVSEKQFDETKNHKLVAKVVYKYKKVYTTKAKIVNDQQDNLLNILL